MEDAESAARTVSTEQLMRSIRSDLRKRELPEVDIDPLEAARARLEAALASTPGYLPPLAGLVEERDWRLKPVLRFRSHRPLLGRLLIFVKRRLVLPVVYWLYEYCSKNFRAQQRINDGLMILTDSLAKDNARLRREVERLSAMIDGGLSGSAEEQEEAAPGSE